MVLPASVWAWGRDRGCGWAAWISIVLIHPLKALLCDDTEWRRQRATSPGRWEIGKEEAPFLDLTLIFLHWKMARYLHAFTQPLPEARGRGAGAGQDPRHTEPYVWFQLRWGASAAEEGLRILQWFLAWLEIPGVCEAGPELCYTSAATMLLLSCSTCPEKPRSTAEAVHFVSFSLRSKCDCEHLQQDPSWSCVHILCVCPCYNLTGAWRRTGKETLANQGESPSGVQPGTQGWLWGRCLVQYLCFQEWGLTKWPQLPFTGSRKGRLAAAEGKAGGLPSQGFWCSASSGILLCPARRHSWPSLAWLLVVVSQGFASSAPWRPVYSLKQKEALQMHAATPYIPLMISQGAGLGNNQHPGNALHWCINLCKCLPQCTRPLEMGWGNPHKQW